MSPTPVEKLDDAIREYVSAISDDDDNGVLSHWVLTYEQTQLVLEQGVDPLISRPGYSVGPGTTITVAIGLTRILQRELDRIGDDLNDGDPDD